MTDYRDNDLAELSAVLAEVDAEIAAEQATALAQYSPKQLAAIRELRRRRDDREVASVPSPRTTTAAVVADRRPTVSRPARIEAVPQTFRGVRFRSTLEADWAATLDSLGIVWQYEPEAVRLPSGEYYRPDFFLPEIATWLEVKGPHNDRIDKVRELAAAGEHVSDCQGWQGKVLRLQACTPEQERGIAAAVAAGADGPTVLTVTSFRVTDEVDAAVSDESRLAELVIPGTTRVSRFRRGVTVDNAMLSALDGLGLPLGVPRWLHCTCWASPWRLVVIGRAAVAGLTMWEDPREDVNRTVLARCGKCRKASFVETEGSWCCRRCGCDGKTVFHGQVWVPPVGIPTWSGEPLPFVRAPRAAGGPR